MRYTLLGEEDDTFESCSYRMEAILGSLWSSITLPADITEDERTMLLKSRCEDPLIQVGLWQRTIENVLITFDDDIILSIGDRFTEIDGCYGPTTHNTASTILYNIAERMSRSGLFTEIRDWSDWSNSNDELRAKIRDLEKEIANEVCPNRGKLETMLRTERLLFFNAAPARLVDEGEVSGTRPKANYDDYLKAIELCGQSNISSTRNNIGNVLREKLDRAAGNRLLAEFRSRLHKQQN